jgi:hypothetical protein
MKLGSNADNLNYSIEIAEQEVDKITPTKTKTLTFRLSRRL